MTGAERRSLLPSAAMRHDRWMLAAGAGLVLGCAIPNTLGLPCITHAHCDAGQHCGPDQVCIDGGPPMMDSGPSSGPPLPPPTVGPDSSTSSSGDATIGLDSGSTGTPSTSTSSTTDDTTGAACGQAIGSCDAVDVLFVVDNSGSMEDDNAQLIPAFSNVNELVGSLIEGPCTYRIGVTTTEVAPDFQPPECQVRGALSRAGAICSDPFGDPEHPPWISETDNVSTLGCLLAVGTNYDTDEKQLQTVIESIGPTNQGPGGCNEGFMREGVPLIVIVVTDEDDDDDSANPAEAPNRTGSDGNPGSWFEDLTALKPASELGVVVLAATQSEGCDWVPESGLSDGSGAEYANRLLTFLGYFTGAGFSDHFRSVNLCQPADDILDQIGELNELLTTVCADAGA